MAKSSNNLRYSSLGGSPLGLIGLFSVPRQGNMSGFNASPNFKVNSYNTGKTKSIFSGNRRLRAYPNISGSATKNPDKVDIKDFDSIDPSGISDVYMENGKFVDNSVSSKPEGARGRNTLHNNDVYDTSIVNILTKLSGTRAALRATDFAYLKDVGVYPNNRLMIARRFVAPVRDNLMANKAKNTAGIPAAVLISWVPEDENFVDITFGEVWTEAKADFTGMLNALGEDFMSKSGMGGVAGAAGNAIPLPGFTEILQRKFLAELGLIEGGAADSIPAGNPNLVKEAKVRKTIGYGEAGAGLMAKISIKMSCEYELKFISGIDPTIVWMDLISMILKFGTSESSNYGLSQGVAATLSKWANNPASMITDIATKLKSAINAAQEKLKSTLKAIKDAAYEAAEKEDEGTASTAAEKSAREQAEELADSAYDAGIKMLNNLIKLATEIIKATVMKYRVEMMGIVNALTGNPSTPWHITIGNPMRPVFCSGDMLTTEVNLRLGPTLAFNDLPSSIMVDFTLTNARALGLQELMSKFNSGYLRTVDTAKSFFETQINFKGEGKNARVASEEIVGTLWGDKDGVITTDTTAPVVNNAETAQTNDTSGTKGTTANVDNTTVVTNTDGTDGTTGRLPKPEDLPEPNADEVPRDEINPVPPGSEIDQNYKNNRGLFEEVPARDETKYALGDEIPTPDPIGKLTPKTLPILDPFKK
jgi:hypothetical protein